MTAAVWSLLKYKMVVPRTKVLDLAEGRVSAVVSTEAVDRDGDIIRVEGWQLDNFLKHPVLLSSHNYGSLRSVIGEWESMEAKSRPARLEGVARYYIGDGNEEADWAFKLVERGRAAYSVGFIPDMDKATQLDEGRGFMGSWEYNGQELLEVSHVAIPSNPQALQALKSLMEARPGQEPDFLFWITETLKEVTPAPVPEEVIIETVFGMIETRDVLEAVFSQVYKEVYPW